MKYSKFMKIDKIIVKTKETTYPILVGNGSISLLKKQVNKLCPNTKKIAVIFDKNVPNIFKTKIKKLLKKYKIFIKDYSPSEGLKNFLNVNIFIVENLNNLFKELNLTDDDIQNCLDSCKFNFMEVSDINYKNYRNKIVGFFNKIIEVYSSKVCE